MGAFETREQAAQREIDLIGRYGRKGIDDGGVLLNRSIGGESGASGWKPTAAQLSKMRKAQSGKVARTAKKYGFTDEEWSLLKPNERSKVAVRYTRLGKRGKDLREGLESLGNIKDKPYLKYGLTQQEWSALSEVQIKNISATAKAATSYDMSLSQWLKLTPTKRRQTIANTRLLNDASELGMEFSKYKKLSVHMRRRAKEWRKKNPVADISDWALGNEKQNSAAMLSLATRAAKKYGVPVGEWLSLPVERRRIVAKRFTKGKRGADLLKNLESPFSLDMGITAKKYGVPVERWAALDAKTRAAIGRRYRKGKRGAALLEGLI